MSLDSALQRYSSLLLSTRYTADETDFKIKQQGSPDVPFTMLFSRDDFDRMPQMGKEIQEVRDKVIGYCPDTYTVDDVEHDLLPGPSLFMLYESKWYRWDQTVEHDGGGFLLIFSRSEMATGVHGQNWR